MNSVFSAQILAEKLSKLNSTQQCIETLSHWCIFHQSKADVAVTTWYEQFIKSEVAQKVPLLYLANDILQNSKRKGNEFVTEFWKVLPSALKDLNEKGDELGKKVVSRLVKIWEERRVFGSKAQNLQEMMLNNESLPPLEFTKKRSRSVKIVRRDSRSIRTKLSIGGPAEKIVSALHSVVSEHSTEDLEMSKCKTAINRVRKMEGEVDIACSQAKDPRRKFLAKDLEEQENILRDCMEKLKSVEANRVVLVTQLRDVLREQESELENVRTQMQVAQAQAAEANNMRKRLCDENYVATETAQGNGDSGQKSKKSAADIAAEVADKLTASKSSQLIMTSVLSSFAAEELKNAVLGSATPASSSFPANSASKQEQPVPVSNGFVPAQPTPTTPAHHFQTMLVNQPTLQIPSPSAQSQYQLLPNTASQQYAQASRGVAAYGYGTLPAFPPGQPPPPPPPPHGMGPVMPMGQSQLQMNQQQLMTLGQQPTALNQQQSMVLMQHPSGPPNFRGLQPPSMLYYAQSPHPQ